jgi:COP9 signalosome complex subunit 5
MGVMYGKVWDHTFYIMDAAALPVQGTETRVNAGNEVCLIAVSVAVDVGV